MRHLLLILVVVALVGCGKKSSREPQTKQADVNATTTPKTQPKEEASNTQPPKVAPEKLIADPIIEKAIRGALSTFSSKFTGELTKADLEKVPSLYLSGNQLTEVPNGLEKFTQLKGLNLSGNRLTDVTSLEKLTQLESLLLGNNKLTEVSNGLEKLTQLKELYLSGNQLTDVKGLEKLTQLKELYLDGNQLTDVKGLEKLTQLKELHLDGNQLTDVRGLEKLTQLTRLDLRGNPDLTKAQIAELQKALPNCKIEHNAKK